MKTPAKNPCDINPSNAADKALHFRLMGEKAIAKLRERRARKSELEAKAGGADDQDRSAEREFRAIREEEDFERDHNAGCHGSWNQAIQMPRTGTPQEDSTLPAPAMNGQLREIDSNLSYNIGVRLGESGEPEYVLIERARRHDHVDGRINDERAREVAKASSPDEFATAIMEKAAEQRVHSMLEAALDREDLGSPEWEKEFEDLFLMDGAPLKINAHLGCVVISPQAAAAIGIVQKVVEGYHLLGKAAGRFEKGPDGNSRFRKSPMVDETETDCDAEKVMGGDGKSYRLSRKVWIEGLAPAPAREYETVDQDGPGKGSPSGTDAGNGDGAEMTIEALARKLLGDRPDNPNLARHGTKSRMISETAFGMP